MRAIVPTVPRTLPRGGWSRADPCVMMRRFGGVAEWLKAPVLKTGDGRPSVGSNPTPSARNETALRAPFFVSGSRICFASAAMMAGRAWHALCGMAVSRTIPQPDRSPVCRDGRGFRSGELSRTFSRHGPSCGQKKRHPKVAIVSRIARRQARSACSSGEAPANSGSPAVDDVLLYRILANFLSRRTLSRGPGCEACEHHSYVRPGAGGFRHARVVQ